MSPRELTVEELAEALVERLQKRHYKRSGKVYRTVYQLDLRGERWADLGHVVLRNPKAPGWPDAGDTTDREGTAERWIFSDYAAWVQQQLQGMNVKITVAQAAKNYIAAIEKEKGRDDSSVSQRRSYINGHVVPALGAKRLAALTPEDVQDWLDNLTVAPYQFGERVPRPASGAATDACRAALTAIWEHTYRGRPRPWGRLTIRRKAIDAAKRKQMVMEGRGHELIQKETYSRDEVFTLLAAARWADLNPEAGHLALWACRNLAPAIALQLAFASRIAELMEIRWRDIDLEDGFVLIAGTKTANALRFLPLQDSARPWIEVLRATQNGIREDHYLFRTHPDRNERPIKDIYARRMARVQKLAGLKLEGKRSHIFRKTHASWALMAGISSPEIKMMLGHSGALGGATDAYVKWVKQSTRPEFRTYLALPTPEEIDVFLATGWTPPGAKKR